MNCVRCVLSLFVAGVHLVADLAIVRVADEAGASLAGSLRGAWRATSMVRNGEPLPESNVRQLMLVFSDKTITMRVGQGVLVEAAYTINAESKPTAIDMTFQGQATLGIHERTSENLRICLNELGKGRPQTRRP